MLIDLKQAISKHNLNLRSVIHCGASTGQEAKVYNELGLYVIWIEAIPKVFDELAKNIQQYENQEAVNACLSNENGILKKFHISNNEAQSSSYLPLGTHKTAHPEVHYVEDVEVYTMRLDSIIDSFGLTIDETWLLVADLQGAEMDAMMGCSKYIDKFGAIYLEVNTQEVYEGCALKSEIEDYLAQYNYKPVEEFIYQQWGWGDELFISKKLL